MKKGVVILAAGLWLCSFAPAAGQLQKRSDRQELGRGGQALAEVKSTVARLTRAIDLWHEANIHNAARLVKEREKEILNIVEADIRSNATFVLTCRLEVDRSERELEGPHATAAGKADDRRDWRDDRANLKRMEGILKVKERLYTSLRRSESFSSKYRLLGDYVDMLRQELRSQKIEVAEDVSEAQEH
jgi:hypothetical protein